MENEEELLLENEEALIWTWFEENHKFNLTYEDSYEIFLNTVIENHSGKENKFKDSFLDELIINFHEHTQAINIKESFKKLLLIVRKHSIEISRKILIDLQDRLNESNAKILSQEVRFTVTNFINYKTNDKIIHYDCGTGNLLYEMTEISNKNNLKLNTLGFTSKKKHAKTAKFLIGENSLINLESNISNDKYDYVIISDCNLLNEPSNCALQSNKLQLEQNEDFFLLDKILMGLKICEFGKIIVILDSKAISQKNNKMAIQHIVDEGLLSTVISMPQSNKVRKNQAHEGEVLILILDKNQNKRNYRNYLITCFVDNEATPLLNKMIKIPRFDLSREKKKVLFINGCAIPNFNRPRNGFKFLLFTIQRFQKQFIFLYLLVQYIISPIDAALATIILLIRTIFDLLVNNKKIQTFFSFFNDLKSIWIEKFDFTGDFKLLESEIDEIAIKIKHGAAMVDLTTLLILRGKVLDRSSLADISEISFRDYLLFPSLYTDKHSQKMLECFENNSFLKLSQFGISLEKKGHVVNNLYLKIKDLSASIEDKFLDIKEIDKFDKSVSNYRNLSSCILKEGDIVFSLANKYLRPTIYNHKEECEFLFNNDDKIVIFRASSKENSEYIFYQLHSDSLHKQLDLFYEATGKTSIKENYFLDLKVPKIPSKDKEKFLAQQKTEIIKYAKSKEESKKRIQDIKIKAEEELFQSLQFLSHDLNPKFQTIKTNIKIIEKVVEQHGLSNTLSQEPLNSDDKVKTNNELLTNSVKTIEHIVNLLKEVSKKVIIAPNETNFEWWDIKKLFIDDIIPNLPTQIDFHFECNAEIALNINQPLFKELFDNLFRNAIIHGLPPNKEKIKVVIRLLDDDDYIIINYTNDGNSFPDNINESEFLTFGNKNKNSPGDGIGGALISKVLKIHNASFKIIRDKSNPVHFVFTFPKGANNEY